MNWKYPLFWLYDKLSGMNVCKIHKELMKSQNWSIEKAEAFQLQRLTSLNIANNWVDFYKLPLMTKEDLRKASKKCKENLPKKYTEHSSSGSTGEPLITYGPKELQSIKTAVFMRSWKNVGWNGTDWILRLTAGEPQWKVYDYLRNIKPMNYRTISDKHVDWVIKNKPFLIHGGSGAIRELTDKIIAKGREDILSDMKVYLMSEDVHVHTKILKMYYKEVHSGYGLAELCTVASGRGKPGFYLTNMECCICEVIDGEIVVTDLWNNLMPVVRYKTKDFGSTEDGDNMLCNVHGRQVDYYNGPELNRPTGWWMLSPISHYYGKYIKQWKMEVLPKKKLIVLYYVPRNKDNMNVFYYNEFVRENLGDEWEVNYIKQKTMSNKSMHLLKVIK